MVDPPQTHRVLDSLTFGSLRWQTAIYQRDPHIMESMGNGDRLLNNRRSQFPDSRIPEIFVHPKRPNQWLETWRSRSHCGLSTSASLTWIQEDWDLPLSSRYFPLDIIYDYSTGSCRGVRMCKKLAWRHFFCLERSS